MRGGGGASDAHEFVVRTVAAALGYGPESAAVVAAAQVRDWDEVLRHCWRNGVVPLVHRQSSSATMGIPEHAAAELQRQATVIASRNLELTADLLEVIGVCERAQVSVISYKGPVLAARAYGNLALRHFNDLDVLIHRSDLAAAIEALKGCGYAQHDPRHPWTEEATRRWGHHYSFLRGNTLLEVHWRFHKPLFGKSLGEESVWARAEQIAVAGQRVKALAVSDELLVIATHGAWHGWSQLSWVCDFAALLRSATELQIDALIANAGALGYLRPLRLAFGLSHELLGAEPDAGLSAAIGSDLRMESLIALICRRMRVGAGPDAQGARLQFTLRERLGDKVAFGLRALFQPNPSDIRAIRLPARLFPLYYVIRPFRMGIRYRPRAAFEQRRREPGSIGG